MLASSTMVVLDGKMYAHLLWCEPCHYLFNTLYPGLHFEPSCKKKSIHWAKWPIHVQCMYTV